MVDEAIPPVDTSASDAVMNETANSFRHLGDQAALPFQNIANSVGNATGYMTSSAAGGPPDLMTAVYAIFLLIAAIFLFRFMEVVVKFVIIIIILWVLASIFGFVV